MVDSEFTPETHSAIRRSPKYERLRTYLFNEIASGRLKPGQNLPSEPHLASTMGLARNTVRQAMAIMEQDGLIERINGKGTFVHKDAMAKVRGRNTLFALVVPEQNGIYSALLESFSAAAQSAQGQVLSATTNDDCGVQANVVLQMMERNIAGVVLVPTSSPPTPASHVTQLQRVGIPVVLCHRGIDGVKAPLIQFSGEEIGELAGQALAAHGHKRIGFVTQSRYRLTDDMAAALRSVIGRAGGELPDELVVHGADEKLNLFDESDAATVVRRLLNRDDRPTALFVSPDVVAEVVYLQLLRAGVRVPQDVSLIGFGESRRRGAVQKSLVSVVVDEEKVGGKAFEILRQMSFGERPITEDFAVMTPLHVSPGTSIGTVPGVVKALAV